MNKQMRFSPYVLIAVCVAMLMLLPASAGAQSGPPPPPDPAVCYPPAGTTVVAATYPPVPPAGIPPVVGDGALAVIPPAQNAVAVITTALGGCRGTFVVPADPARSLAVRIQGGLAVSQLPQPALPNASGAACRFSVDIYDAATGQHVSASLPSSSTTTLVPGSQAGAVQRVQLGTPQPAAAPVISAFTAALMPGPQADAMQMLYFDPVQKAWLVVPGSAGPAAGVHSGQIGQVGICCVAAQPGVPTALPNTGGGIDWLGWPLATVLVVGVVVAGGFGWSRRAHRTAS
jgi:hypothetical protein